MQEEFKMGIKFGEIDANQILENEYRIGVLERLLQWIVNNNPTLNGPPPAVVQEIRREVISQLQRKYPKSGIELREG
jgi:hypothetical protein